MRLPKMRPSLTCVLIALAILAPATPASADFVINDDLIVTSSICVGFDCVNGEVFDFDTLKLKENNLRIKFEDTSIGSFPTTDWQLTANDSFSGGLSKFSIEDVSSSRIPFTIVAGAPNNSLFVSSSGRVGIRTATPVLDLHVVSGNTPSLRLDQDGSQGFTPQVWDLAGNEVNFFVRDVTGGSKLPLRIQPGAPSSSFFVATSGNVGLRTAAPTAPLDVNLGTGTAGVGNAVALLQKNGPLALQLKDTTANIFWNFSVVDNAAEFRVSKQGTGVTEMTVDSGGNVRIPGSYFANNVQLNVPDYVFEPDYKLMPLAELGSFVERERHLPNIPAADEVRRSGLNMTDMQMRLLEKIEELTLYVVQQHESGLQQLETIEVLRGEVRELQARLQ